VHDTPTQRCVRDCSGCAVVTIPTKRERASIRRRDAVDAETSRGCLQSISSHTVKRWPCGTWCDEGGVPSTNCRMEQTFWWQSLWIRLISILNSSQTYSDIRLLFAVFIYILTVCRLTCKCCNAWAFHKLFNDDDHDDDDDDDLHSAMDDLRVDWKCRTWNCRTWNWRTK